MRRRRLLYANISVSFAWPFQWSGTDRAIVVWAIDVVYPRANFAMDAGTGSAGGGALLHARGMSAWGALDAWLCGERTPNAGLLYAA